VTDEDLLASAENALRDAIWEAEVSRLPKDLAYAQMVANKVEGLRAKRDCRLPVRLCLSFVGHRVHIEYSLAALPRFGSEVL